MEFIESGYGSWLNDIIFTQMFTFVGDLRTLSNLNFHRNPGNMVNIYYALFLAMMNVLIINILIAVLADSYAKVTEKRDKWAKNLKIQLLSSLIPVLPNKEKQDVEDIYMIIVKPIGDKGNGEEDWTGKINKIVEMTQESNNALERNLIKRQKKFKADIQAAVKGGLSSVNNVDISIISDSLAEMKEKQKKMKER